MDNKDAFLILYTRLKELGCHVYRLGECPPSEPPMLDAKGRRINRKCVWCGKIFKETPDHCIFCSEECYRVGEPVLIEAGVIHVVDDDE